MTGLTTQVLDTASGKPAAGVAPRLKHGGDVLVSTKTDADGRCISPPLTGAAFAPFGEVIEASDRADQIRVRL